MSAAAVERDELLAVSRSLRLANLNLKVDGVQFDLSQYPFLIDIFDDEHPDITVRKGSQLGLTVAMVLRTIDKGVHQWKRGALYLMPTRDDVSDFSKSRFDRMMKDNPVLSRFIGGTDSINIKRVGGSFVYFRGAKSRSQLKSIPVDAVVVDEEDEMEQRQVELALHRLDAAQKFKVGSKEITGERVSLSTPTIPDYGVDLKYKQTDQNEWHIRCGCGGWTCLEETFPTCLERDKNGRAFRACSKCKKELELAKGQWVPAKPSVKEKRGYYISQLNSPTVSAGEILDEYENPSPGMNLQEFWNHRLGRAYADFQDVLEESMLRELCREDAAARAAQGPCFIGADVGKEDIHWIVAQKPSESLIEVLNFGIATRFSDLHDVWTKFNVLNGVIDEMAETRKVREFLASHGSCYGCWYSDAQRTAYDWKDNEQRVAVNRTELLDHSHRMVLQKRVSLPRPDDRWPTFVKHMRNLARLQERHPETGMPRTRWVIRGGRKLDHWRHAFAYLVLAAERAPITERARLIRGPREYNSGVGWMAR